ncbi:hypothetical protein RN001_012385 [Aquatica leii]|uniref:Uncharacterized protein n=1 Tax=Aquatica leii TaxID=1421715 RepID=A0AAN7P5E3_9COLE|nr:hypothetical protein RN001_012385 [Aquatica leii]
MDTNSVSPMPELAPIAEFDKTPPTPPEETLPMDDLPPPPTTVTVQDEKKEEDTVTDAKILAEPKCNTDNHAYYKENE